jgi:hypothetical protein
MINTQSQIFQSNLSKFEETKKCQLDFPKVFQQKIRIYPLEIEIENQRQIQEKNSMTFTNSTSKETIKLYNQTTNTNTNPNTNPNSKKYKYQIQNQNQINQKPTSSISITKSYTYNSNPLQHQQQDQILIDIFKYENNLKIEEKIYICFEILQNKNRIIFNYKFYEEECLYCLINWALKSSFDINYSFINKKDNLQENFILLNSIIFIFQYFPLNQKDFKSFKIMQKLNKIKKNIKNINLNSLSLIDNLIFNMNNNYNNINLIGNKTLNNNNYYNINNKEEEVKINTNAPYSDSNSNSNSNYEAVAVGLVGKEVKKEKEVNEEIQGKNQSINKVRNLFIL